MRVLFLSKFLSACALLITFFSLVLANGTTDEAAKLLPDRLGDFRATGAASSKTDKGGKPGLEDIEIIVERKYRSPQGTIIEVGLVKMLTEKSAYALFSSEGEKVISGPKKVDGVGTAAMMTDMGHLFFYKGTMWGRVYAGVEAENIERATAFAKQLADSLDKGEGEIPVIVKHLPDWETVQLQAVYALSLPALQQAAGNRPVLEAVNFAGGADAVTASYGPSRMVIIEHTTPQLATDDDARINAKINELKSGGQPVPTLYRRVGNYAVFVFDAPDEATAGQLVEKINYEQVVQWLGNNPHWMERAEREYRQTTAGVILSVIKGTGLSLLICLGIGGIFGSIIFKRRRAQAAMTEAYSDAGGMLRLNLDEMTPHVDPSRLLGKGDG